MVLLLVLFVTSFAVGRSLPKILDLKRITSTLDVRLAAIRPGRQLVFVYIGSSKCGPANFPGLAAQVFGIKESLRKQAINAGLGFVTIGIAQEMDPNAGIAHLRSIMDFDELAAGQGELNQASAHFVSRDHRGATATPQIVLVERGLHAEDSIVALSGHYERVLIRRIGRYQIRTWFELGAPVPELLDEERQRAAKKPIL